MKHSNAKREALVEAVLSRFFQLYTVVVTIDGRFVKRPLFVRRSGAGSRFRINPDIPEAFFDQGAELSGCPCCGAAAPNRGRSVR
jgi:hypothetical protein